MSKGVLGRGRSRGNGVATRTAAPPKLDAAAQAALQSEIRSARPKIQDRAAAARVKSPQATLDKRQFVITQAGLLSPRPGSSKAFFDKGASHFARLGIAGVQ